MAFSRQYLEGTGNKKKSISSNASTTANRADTFYSKGTDVAPYIPGKSSNTNSDNTDTGKKDDGSTSSTQTPSTTPVKTQTQSTTATNTQSQFKLPTYTASQYAQSQSVLDAKAYLESLVSNKPGNFSSDYETQVDDLMNQIMNRDKFSYDLNSDMLYQQAKDQYTALGKMAMQDTMGQAAALTGGYGNSYAATAGNQAYQNYLQELNSNIPEYYQMALNQYNQEGNELYNQYAMARDAYSNDYNMYRDSISDYYNDYANAYNDYINLLNQDYNQYIDSENRRWDSFVNEQNLAYQMNRDAIADDKWQKEFALREAEHNLALDSAKNVAQAAGELSIAELNKLEELYADADNEAIGRLLDTWSEQGKISPDEAERLMEVYYTDDFEMDVNEEALNAPLLDGYMSRAAALASGNLDALDSTTVASRGGSSDKSGLNPVEANKAFAELTGNDFLKFLAKLG